MRTRAYRRYQYKVHNARALRILKSWSSTSAEWIDKYKNQAEETLIACHSCVRAFNAIDKQIKKDTNKRVRRNKDIVQYRKYTRKGSWYR